MTVLPQTDSKQSDCPLPQPAPAQTPRFQLPFPLVSPHSCFIEGLTHPHSPLSTAVHQAAPCMGDAIYPAEINDELDVSKDDYFPRLYRFF